MKKLTEILKIDHPIIMAPMFLVSTPKMIIEALKSGITGAIPAMNFRTTEALRAAIKEIKSASSSPFGINLIVNKSNIYLKEQLAVCCEEKIAFIITSLGSPKETIEIAHQHGVLVFCDVTDVNYAKKVESLGADAIIAVNNLAGGHAGTLSFDSLLPELISNCSIPIISAGGIGNNSELKTILNFGVAGVSIGSIFIASEEAEVSEEYKNACVQYSDKDIVLSTKLSGTPCTVIKTPYVEKIGVHQNCVERFLNSNKRLKKWLKIFTFYKGMNLLKKAAFEATYKTVWCAGPSIKHVHSIRSIKQIIRDLVSENS
jgi:nitronate monooxygenase